MTVSIAAAGPGLGLPLPANTAQAPLAQIHSMASVGIVDAALGGKQFLFEDHPSLLPGRGIGQAEVPLPALVLSV